MEKSVTDSLSVRMGHGDLAWHTSHSTLSTTPDANEGERVPMVGECVWGCGISV